MKITPGYYAVKHEGHVIPVHFNDGKWKHGDKEIAVAESDVIHPIALGCPTGCTCTPNQDGTVTVNCHQQ